MSPAAAYDVIVVGGRCAGAPLAMLLARRGRSVLLLERARMPSDALSTHWIRGPGVRFLHDWGLLDRLLATGCPPLRQVTLDFEGRRLRGCPFATVAPRRAVLDELLWEAAREAGADVHDRTGVRELLRDGDRVIGVRATSGGRELTARAQLVVGADGCRSAVARHAGADVLDDRGVLARTTYDYWSGCADSGLRVRFRGRRAVSEWPTHDGLTVAALVFPIDEPRPPGRDGLVEHYLAGLREISGLPRGATRCGPIRTAAVRNLRRRAHGPGWALAGDAGQHKDPVSAQGISDAFADAAALSATADAALRGELPMDEATARYAAERDAERLEAFEDTCRQAQLHPPDEEFHRQVREAGATPEAALAFLNGFVGATSPGGAAPGSGLPGRVSA